MFQVRARHGPGGQRTIEKVRSTNYNYTCIANHEPPFHGQAQKMIRAQLQEQQNLILKELFWNLESKQKVSKG